MKALKKMANRNTTSCDVQKTLTSRSKLMDIKELDKLYLYKKIDSGEPSPKKIHQQGYSINKNYFSNKKQLDLSTDWRSGQEPIRKREGNYIEVGKTSREELVFSSSQENGINFYEFSNKKKKKLQPLMRLKDTQIKRELSKGIVDSLKEAKSMKDDKLQSIWQEFNRIKEQHGLENDIPGTSLRKVDSHRIRDLSAKRKSNIPISRMNLVYKEERTQVRHTPSKVVDIYKEKSRALYEERGVSGKLAKKKKKHRKIAEKSDERGKSSFISHTNKVLVKLEEIKARFNLNLTKGKRKRKTKKLSPGIGWKSGVPRVKPKKGKVPKQESIVKQVQLEEMIKINNQIAKGKQSDLSMSQKISQYQSLNYSERPKSKDSSKMKNSGSRIYKKLKIKEKGNTSNKNIKRCNERAHIRNNSSSTLVENVLIKGTQNRGKATKKISNKDRNSMHSDMLINVREQTFKHMKDLSSRKYTKPISRTKRDLSTKNFSECRKRNFNTGNSRRKINLQTRRQMIGKDLQIKEYDPLLKSEDCQNLAKKVKQVEKPSKVSNMDPENDQKLLTGKCFSSHHELYGQSEQQKKTQRISGRNKDSSDGIVVNKSLESIWSNKRLKRGSSYNDNLVFTKKIMKQSVLNKKPSKNAEKDKPKLDKRSSKIKEELEAQRSFIVNSKKKRAWKNRLVSEDKRKLRKQFYKQGSTTINNLSSKTKNEKEVINYSGLVNESGRSLVFRPKGYIVSNILEKKGFLLSKKSSKIAKIEAIDEPTQNKKSEGKRRRQSQSVKRTVNGMRRSAVHLDKAIVKFNNKKPNFCNVSAIIKNKIKSGFQQRVKKPKKKILHLNLKTKENLHVRSPKIKQHPEGAIGEEINKKRGIHFEKKKRKLNLLSTKNLLSKFNKISYFEFKKSRKGGERTGQKLRKDPQEKDERTHKDQSERNFSVNKVSKRNLYERYAFN